MRQRVGLNTITAIAGLGMVLVASRAWADSVPYQFSVNQAASGVTGPVAFNAKTVGDLRGNWDKATNPTGTRTKPGLFGPFGPEDNDPVPLKLGVGLADALNSKVSGAFGMGLDTGLGLASLEGFSANLLASGSAGLTANLSFEFDSFRTASPNSLYIGGIPLTVPIGEVQFTKLQATQVGEGVGTLTNAGGNLYDFSIAMVLQLEGEIDLLGNVVALPAVPLPVLLAGQVTLAGATAELTAAQLLELAGTIPIGQAIPEFAFALPTILPPGGEANLLLNLTLEELVSELGLQLQLSASGKVVPAPGVVPLLGLGVGGLIARRRRRFA
jgi:hypothetical protein